MKRIVGMWQLCLKNWYGVGAGADDANGLESSGGTNAWLLAGGTPIWLLVLWEQSCLDVWLGIEPSEAVTPLADGQSDFEEGGG